MWGTADAEINVRYIDPHVSFHPEAGQNVALHASPGARHSNLSNLCSRFIMFWVVGLLFLLLLLLSPNSDNDNKPLDKKW